MLALRRISDIFNHGLAKCCLSLILLAQPLSANPKSIQTAAAMQKITTVSFGWVRDYFNAQRDDVDPEDLVDFLISLRMSVIGMGFQPPTIQDLISNLQVQMRQSNNPEHLDFLDEIYELAVEKEPSLPWKITGIQNRNLPSTKMLLAKHKKKVLRMDEGIKDALYKGASDNGIPIREYLDQIIDLICTGRAGPGDFSRVLKYAIRLREFLDNPNDYVVERKLSHPKDKGAIALCEVLAGALLILVPVPPVQAIGVAAVTHGLATLAEAGVELSDQNRQNNLPPPVEYVDP